MQSNTGVREQCSCYTSDYVLIMLVCVCVRLVVLQHRIDIVHDVAWIAPCNLGLPLVKFQ